MKQPTAVAILREQTAPKVRSATTAQIERFEATMTLAFSADPAARWAWPDPAQFLAVFRPLVMLFGGKAFDHSSALVVGDFLGVCQWLPPNVLPDDDPICELFERNMTGPRLGELLSLFDRMAGFHPKEPHWYLPLIGVDPQWQGQGYGRMLMEQALALCDRGRQPAYLEATSPANRRFYERYGFRAIGEIRSAGSPPLFPMLREPQQITLEHAPHGFST
jgi:ribosomal protein S18 acetylase RimI-like enzyme